MDSHSLAETIALLQRVPSTFNALLRDLPDSWTRRNEGGDTWTAFDVIGHLVHGERTDWMPRIHRILRDGEGKPFDPFDRFAHVRVRKDTVNLPGIIRERHEFDETHVDRLVFYKIHKIKYLVVITSGHDYNIEFDRRKA